MTTLQKFQNGVSRLDAYGAPSDGSPLFVDSRGCSYELLDGNEVHDQTLDPQPLTLGDLRALLRELGQ